MASVNQEDSEGTFQRYMEWMNTNGGREALDRNALMGRRLDTIYSPGAGEYIYFSGAPSNEALAGGLYDDQWLDPGNHAWAYPEMPNFQDEWHQLNNGVDLFGRPIVLPEVPEAAPTQTPGQIAAAAGLTNEPTHQPPPQQFTPLSTRPGLPEENQWTRFNQPGGLFSLGGEFDYGPFNRGLFG